MPKTAELPNSTLELMILKAASFGPAHGYAIARWIQAATDDILTVEEGTLYPALHRLEERGFVDAEWGLSENNRRAKYYRLTAAGRRQLRAAASSFRDHAAAVARALGAGEEPV